MFFSLNLIEILPLYIVDIFFFLFFFVVMLLGYPIGRYLLFNYCENNLIKNSIFSLSVFAAVISIVVNLAPIFSKYVIVIFYLLNFYVLIASSNIRNDFLKAIISSKFILFSIFIIFLIVNLIYKPISIEEDRLIFLFDTHYTYFVNPISEILTSDYFSRIKILSFYPYEWSAYHFFQAGFNSIFLSPVYLSGTIGLISLKNFYLSIFLSLFFFSFFKEKNLNINKNFSLVLKLLLTILILISLFFPKIIWLIQTNGFVSALLVIFIVQSLLSKNKNDLLIWAIILSLSSFRNVFISLMLFIYYLFDTQNFNFEIFVNKIKKIINLPNLLLSILFLLYFMSTFYQTEVTAPKYNLLSHERPWWLHTTTNNIIENSQYFLLIVFLSIITFYFLSKIVFTKKLKLFPNFEKKDLFYFSLVLILPSICIILLVLKNQILDIYNVEKLGSHFWIALSVNAEKLKIFFYSFDIPNLSFYFFVPLIWCLLLFNFKILSKYIFTILVIIYTFLSIFINNAIILPAFFVTELLILFFISHIFLDFNNNFKNGLLSYLLIISVIILSFFNPLHHKSFTGYRNGDRISFKFKDLKALQKKKYLCPNDINQFSSYKYYASALSAILVKPYYTDISIFDKYENWGDVASRWATRPKKHAKNPCMN